MFLFQSYFHFRFRGRHFEFYIQPMSGNVGGVISKSGTVENVGVAVRTAYPSLSVQTLFLLPVSGPTINHVLSF